MRNMIFILLGIIVSIYIGIEVIFIKISEKIYEKKVLKEIKSWVLSIKVEEIKDENQGIIRVTLKYDEKGNRVIDGIKRISKPGLRVYAGKEELPKVLNGLGIAIISTSKGLMTDKEARNAGIGGEVLAYIW